jgi:hypothetical protein
MKTPPHLPITKTIDQHPDGNATLLHTSVDIRWLLSTRTSRQLADAVTVNGEKTDDGEEVRNALLNRLAEGHALLPIGDPCEGWDPIKGCPGHRIVKGDGRENAASAESPHQEHHHEHAHGARDP